MESLLGHYGDRVRPGDVFIMNDPFDGGMHLQDIFIVKPVHLEGDADRVGRDDRAPRRRRRAAAGLERLRQHRDLPGGPPHALAAVLRRGRAGRGGAQADRGQHAHPARHVRRPRRPGRGLLGGRAGAAGARDPARPRAARGPDARADRLHRAPRAAGDPHLARRHGHLHRLSRLGRRRGPRRADRGAGDDRGRRGDRRPDRVVADGAGIAQQHALVRDGLRLPGDPLRADARDSQHGRRVQAGHAC